MKNIEQLNVSGHKVIVRLDLNVPLNAQFQVTDFTRISATVPTVKKLLEKGAAVILMSHLGRPKDGPENKFSLRHIVHDLSKAYGVDVQFAEDCIGPKAHAIVDKMNPGEVVLLENLRFHKEEEKGDIEFAKKLAALASVYVNDAFGTAHRAHASTAVMAQFFDVKGCGYVMQAEIENAQKVLDKADKPYTAIMGGAKISDKILIIERLLPKVDNLIIGGAMAYTFFKALGGNVGKSLVEEDKLDLARTLVEKAKALGVNLMLPKDSLCGLHFANDTQTTVADNMHISADMMGLDIGPEAAKSFSEVIANSKTVLWNGPMGVFEMPTFAKGTEEVAKAVVAATEKGGFSLIGGGDSASAVNNLGYGEKVSYVSTGGGALLEYMEGRVLPGVAALEE